MLGLWAFTNLELAYGILRVDERVRIYAIASLTNVLMTVAGSLVLVVALDQGPSGLLLANYGASTLVLLGLWWVMRGRLRPGAGRTPAAPSGWRRCCASACRRCPRRPRCTRSA